MNSYNKKNVGKILMTVLILVLLVIIALLFSFYDIGFTIPNNAMEDEFRYYSKDLSESSNTQLVVSNQSKALPRVRLTCTLDGEVVFKERFKVGSGHSVSYYYMDLSEGGHVLLVSSEAGHEAEYTFTIDDTSKYFYITFWGIGESGFIDINESDEPIYIN